MKSRVGMGGCLQARVIRANGKVEDLGNLSRGRFLRWLRLVLKSVFS